MSTASAARREIPEATVARLPLYLRALAALDSRGVEVVSSEELAEAAGVRSAGLRKDLSHLGSYGVRGVGYDVERLSEEISRELGLHHDWSVAIIGMGNLGHALAAYGGFATRGFSVRWLVDEDPAIIGTEIAGLQVIDFAELAQQAPESIIAVLATPPHAAQQAADQAIALGVRSILNFAPCMITVPPGVEVRKVDLATELQILAFHEQRGRDDELALRHLMSKESGSPRSDVLSPSKGVGARDERRTDGAPAKYRPTQEEGLRGVSEWGDS